ncbi:transglycosylase family protein [Streptomyces sp. NBC_01264]|uniref:LysM peptidoglycan-binding domain-containing protein n=1 Tax=Streptomyces sp. NBC_01264 TaxID=2903804 RepID=UPI002B1D61CF|nr:transglycosylase family protein [Streptomyces sp. NBC_01264]
MPALVVTAGVTGTALALPLLAATGASAAETSTWDQVAECESGGTWSANFGGGAYGGLQFSQEQWKNAGGLDFAQRADLASRSQQIAVAERVLASQGPQAWPLCGVRAGLTQDAPAAEVDPGLPGGSGSLAPTPSRPDDSVPHTGSGKPSTDFGAPTPKSPAPEAPSASTQPDYPIGVPGELPVMPAPDLETPPGLPGDPTAPTSPVDPTAPVTPPSTDPTAPVGPTTPVAPPSTDPTAPVGPTTPVSPLDPANPIDPTDPGNSANPANPVNPVDPTAPTTPGAPGASTAPDGTATPGATGGGGKHRGPAAVEAPAASDAASEATYTVKAGDSLIEIADANGVKGGWKGLYEANEQVIGGDADLIKPGQNLDLTH